MPSLFGARPGALHPDIFPGASVVALVIYVLPLAVALYMLFAAKKRGVEPADRVLLLQVLLLFSIPLVAGFHEDTYKFDMRYVYPVYAPFALLLGLVVCRTRVEPMDGRRCRRRHPALSPDEHRARPTRARGALSAFRRRGRRGRSRAWRERHP